MTALASLRRRIGARLRGVEERAPAVATNTQFLLQLSGYRWVIERFGPLAGRRVLDVAAGEGYGTAALAGAGAWTVGVDVDPEAAAGAARAYPGVTLAVMDGAALGLATASFDLVVSQDTLEHVADDTGFVAELARVLRPGGRLVVFTPHALTHTTTPANPFHLREYSARSLLALLGHHFADLGVFGRRAGTAMAAAEHGLDRVRRWDPLGLRRLLVPSAVRHRLGSWVLGRGGAPALEALSAADVEYFDGAEGSTTLIATGLRREARLRAR